jgi:hypothetical protein
MTEHEQSAGRCPRPLTASVVVLQRLLQELPVNWELSVGGPNEIFIEDERGIARGYLDIARGRIVLVDPEPER